MTNHTSSRILVVDVDGVVSAVSPIDGESPWGDEVVAGNVFGPVYVSPAMTSRLDSLAALPEVSCWWLTSWSLEMREAMDPFPGRSWPTLPASGNRWGRRWWKLVALEAFLGPPPRNPVDGLVR